MTVHKDAGASRPIVLFRKTARSSMGYLLRVLDGRLGTRWKNRMNLEVLKWVALLESRLKELMPPVPVVREGGLGPAVLQPWPWAT